MYITQQQRRDTAANWTTNNPVLFSGEIGHETDTGKSKIGDGVTAWTALGYWQPAGTGFRLQATTGVNGFALVNSSPDFLTWNVPADSQLHRVAVYASQLVTVSETGGTVQVQFTVPGAGASHFTTIFSGGSGASTTGLAGSPFTAVVASGSIVTVSQTSPLSAGAAKVWAEIWGA